MDKLNRQQRRIRERIQKEADEVFNLLARQFKDEFLSEDPESFDVKEMQKKVSAKWKMYCKRNNFKKEALPLMDDFCNKMHEDYKSELANG